jgi:hypothetical protein
MGTVKFYQFRRAYITYLNDHLSSTSASILDISHTIFALSMNERCYAIY